MPLICRSYPYMTDEEVRAIFADYYGQPLLNMKEIAIKYGVSATTIRNILRRKTYADVSVKMTVPK